MSEQDNFAEMTPRTRVKIIGVGGGGVNTVESLMSGGGISLEAAQNATFAAVNTDAQALAGSPVERKLVIGRSLTRGLGAGGEVNLGRLAAEADRASLDALVADADLVVLIVALGGGTGSGAAPVVAEAAAKAGAMVIAFATLPFSWEGERRTKQARESLESLREACEAVVPLHNDMLLQGDGADADVSSAFDRANGWVCTGINALCSMLFKKGLINLDFATLRSALPVRGGRTLFGVGIASGPNRRTEVVQRLLDCPLLYSKDAVRTADTLVVHIVGGPGLSLAWVNGILESVKEKFGGRENTVFGAVIDESFEDKLEVCLLGSSGIARRMKQSPRRNPDAIRSVPVPEDPEAPLGVTDILADSGPRTPAAPPESAETAAAQTAARKASAKAWTVQEQREIAFDESSDFFVDNHTLIDGQDIDVPTFQRRHIRIRL